MCEGGEDEPYAARGSPVATRKCVFWKLLEHSLVTFIRSGFLGLRYVVGLSNKGRKGVVYDCFPYAHMAHRESSTVSSRVRTRFAAGHSSAEPCCRQRDRDGAVASTCGIESWEYWLATGATAALPIWTGMRHVVEKIYLFGGLYCKILFGLM